MREGKASLKLFLSHRASLVRYARSITGSTADAEDVVQEAWLRIHAGTSRLPAAEAIAYLRVTVRNLAFNGLRRRRIEARIFDGDGSAAITELASELPDAETAAISRDEYARVVTALGEMPENMRIAVEMHRIGGAKLKDIAAHLGVSITTAHTLVVNGIERCRDRTDRGSE